MSACSGSTIAASSWVISTASAFTGPTPSITVATALMPDISRVPNLGLEDGTAYGHGMGRVLLEADRSGPVIAAVDGRGAGPV